MEVHNAHYYKNELTNDHIKVLNVLRNTKHNIITKQNIFNQLNMEFTKTMKDGYNILLIV